jgi:IclR family KDG regulon transcriptional repressor
LRVFAEPLKLKWFRLATWRESGKQMAKANDKNGKTYQVHSLERGLDLIEILAEHSREMTLSELSKIAGFTPSTSHRILNALKSRGYVQQSQENLTYRLTHKIFELANQVGFDNHLRDVVLPIIRRLAQVSRDTAFLTVRDGDEAFCLERIDGNPSIRIADLQKGGRMPLHMGGGPRVLLAFAEPNELDHIIQRRGLEARTAKTITNPILLKDDLARVREQGYALSMQDVYDGVAALGAPVREAGGKVVAAVSIAGLSNGYSGESLQARIDLVKRSAQEMSLALRQPVQ